MFFDDASKIKDELVKGIRDYGLDRLSVNPGALHDAVVRVIVKRYDKALWLFRQPVRKIEKGRQAFAKRIQTLAQQSLEDGEGMMGDYISMHELSRHVVHMSETLQVATKTMKAILRNVESRDATEENQETKNNVLEGLRMSSRFMSNLKLRADAFEDRLDNEIRLVGNALATANVDVYANSI